MQNVVDNQTDEDCGTNKLAVLADNFANLFKFLLQVGLLLLDNKLVFTSFSGQVGHITDSAHKCSCFSLLDLGVREQCEIWITLMVIWLAITLLEANLVHKTL